MLPKQHRLSKKEFQQVKNHGRLISGRLMGILMLRKSQSKTDPPMAETKKPQPSQTRPQPNAGLPAEVSAKAGLIVSQKLSNQAVVRNRLKRRLRAALQRVLPDIDPNLHLVLLPNRRALEVAVDELEQDIKKILQLG